MNTSVQEQMPAWYFARYGKPLAMNLVDRAKCWVQKAKRVTRRNAEREFEGRGYEIRYQEMSFGGVRMRARLSMRTKEVFLDPGSEADLFEELYTLGFPLSPSPKALILSHELFHLFCPRCPGQVAELAAHLYVADVLELDYFPGLLDLVEDLQKTAPQAITA